MSAKKIILPLMASLALALSLTACSESAEAPTDVCPSGKLDASEITENVKIGEIKPVKDEGAAAFTMERKWRHYVPVTVTNPYDKICELNVTVAARGDADGFKEELISFVLEPGQSAKTTAFSLDNAFIFTSDSKEGVPEEKVTFSVEKAQSQPVYSNYYDAEIEVGEITGEGADVHLPVVITKNAKTDGMPEWKMVEEDEIFIQGLDSEGNLIGNYHAFGIDGAIKGKSIIVEVPLTVAKNREGGGYSHNNAKALEKIKEFKVVSYQPRMTK